MIDVLIPTFATADKNRFTTVVTAVSLLKLNLVLPPGFELKFYIGLQGEGEDELREELAVLHAGYELVLPGNTGLANNLNALIEASDSPYIIQMDDDHLLTQALDISPHIAYMQEQDWCGWVRLMGVSGHRLYAAMHEDMWVVDWFSPELYITSNRPHIKKRAWHDTFGMYPVRASIGDEEEAFCHQCKDIGRAFTIKDGPTMGVSGFHVCVPVNFNENVWEHVGESWQSKGL